jgi:Bacterial Ig-like domain (group 3)
MAKFSSRSLAAAFAVLLLVGLFSAESHAQVCPAEFQAVALSDSVEDSSPVSATLSKCLPGAPVCETSFGAADGAPSVFASGSSTDLVYSDTEGDGTISYCFLVSNPDISTAVSVPMRISGNASTELNSPFGEAFGRIIYPGGELYVCQSTDSTCTGSPPSSGSLHDAPFTVTSGVNNSASIQVYGGGAGSFSANANAVIKIDPAWLASNPGYTVVFSPNVDNSPDNMMVAVTSAVTSSLNPSAVGQSVTFSATVSAASGTPDGEVTFKNGSANLGTVTLVEGVATFTTSDLKAGTNPITAEYHGNSKFLGTTSPVLNQVVDQATSTVTLSSSLNPSTYGQAVTFTATVAGEFGGTPRGKVKFMNGSAFLGTGTLTGGVATLITATLGVGTQSITAQYDGNSSFSGSTSSALSQVVNQATSTVDLTSSQNPSTAGQSVTFTATIVPQYSGTPGGKVTFKYGSMSLGKVTLVDGVASVTTSALPSGTDTIEANFSGDANFAPSSATLAQMVD